MYDIDTNTRYNAWLRLQHTFISQKQFNTNVTGRHYPVNLLKPSGTLAKILDHQACHIKLPVLSNPSSSAKVITSKENQKRLKEREEKIMAEIKRKKLNNVCHLCIFIMNYICTVPLSITSLVS